VPEVQDLVKGTRARSCPKCDYQFNGKPEPTAAPEPVAVEKKADTVTFEQIKEVDPILWTTGTGVFVVE
jgi:hypothetical protein